jgi:galactokinase
MTDTTELIAAFHSRYLSSPRLFRAPGRVNLIGEHTDYNEGFVLPMAIDRGATVAIAPRPDRKLRIWSLNLQDAAELDLDRFGPGHRGTWIDYAEGVAAAIMSRGAVLTGADIALKSDISIGGGLASSAALEIALGSALLSVSGSRLDGLSLALAGQEAEHKYAGINCGIMDQFVSIHALEGRAILLDCRSLKAKQIPLLLKDYGIVICDSRVHHALASSEYNRRRQECETGVRLLAAAIPGIRALRDVSLAEFEAGSTALPENVLRRCRHVVSENARTLKAADALSHGDLKEMGELMSASHRSLKEDYEVSCRELDLLVESAKSQPGVLGSRMTGGGFGGCTVSLVERRTIDSFREAVSSKYQANTGISPEIFAVEASGGASEIVNVVR